MEDERATAAVAYRGSKRERIYFYAKSNSHQLKEAADRLFCFNRKQGLLNVCAEIWFGCTLIIILLSSARKTGHIGIFAQIR
jgi:hypothetical protein